MRRWVAMQCDRDRSIVIDSRRASEVKVMENSESRRSMADFLIDLKEKNAFLAAVRQVQSRVQRAGACTYVSTATCHLLSVLATRLTPSLQLQLPFYFILLVRYSLRMWKWSGRRFLSYSRWLFRVYSFPWHIACTSKPRDT